MISTKKFLFLFLFINFIVSIFYIDLWSNANTTSRILPIVSYFESGSFQIDKYQELTCDKSIIDDHYYSDKAPLPTFIVFPFFGLLKLTGLIQSNNGSLYGTHVYALGSIICGIIPFVLILFFTFKKIRSNSNFSPVLLSMLPFYASFIFIFSGTFFNHLSSGFFLLLSYMFLKEKKYFIMGIFGGLAFLCEYITALVVVIWACQVLFKERSIKTIFQIGLGALPFIICIMIYNYIFSGSPFTMLYKFNYDQRLFTDYGFSHPTLESLWGLTFSDFRGLFFYAPFILFILFYVLKKIRRFTVKEIVAIIFSNHLFIPSLVIILFISSYCGWWGGWSYGPRMLLFIAVLLLYEGIIFLSREKISDLFFWIVISFGMVSAFMAKATVLYSIPTEIKHPFSGMILPAFLAKNFNPNNLLTLFFGISPGLAFLLWCAIFIFSMIFLTITFKKINLEKR
jgi:hypothetical protein